MDDGLGALCSVIVAFLQERAEARMPLPEIVKMLEGHISDQTAEDLSRLGNVLVYAFALGRHCNGAVILRIEKYVVQMYYLGNAMYVHETCFYRCIF
jgi:hypothetical protein